MASDNPEKEPFTFEEHIPKTILFHIKADVLFSVPPPSRVRPEISG